MAVSPVNDYPSMNTGLFIQPNTEPELVHPDPKYMCPVHGGVLREPTQTPCGHRICRKCLLEYLDEEEAKPCPVEDEDRELVSVHNVFPDPGIMREIKAQDVYCPLKTEGCQDVMKYKDMNRHVAQCPFRPALCPFAVRGCRRSVPAHSLPLHEHSCGFQPATCELCGQEFNMLDQTTHQDAECPESVIPCPYQCGSEMKRRTMEDHISVCTLRPLECQYKALGCGYVGKEPDVREHEKSMESHFDLLVTSVCETKMKLGALPSIDVQLLSGIQEKLNLTDTLLSKLEHDFKSKDDKMADKIAALENSVREVQQEQRIAMEEMGQLKDGLKELQETLEMNTRDLARDLRRLEVRLAENDLRFQILETTSYNGTLMWKIRDFSIRRRDAVQGRTVSLYSQPFFSDRYGYKMCARVYLNGDGAGKGTHVSLYFVVMKGEYDALLPWPFQLQINLVALDQSPAKRHLNERFTPDPSSTSFKRPDRAEMNVASGCPLFVAHSVLDNPHHDYVKDDTLFIMVTVDSSSLPTI